MVLKCRFLGVAGGGLVYNDNGGWPPKGMSQGEDALRLPGPTVLTTNWTSGSTVEVAWRLMANHGAPWKRLLSFSDPPYS